MAPCSKRGGDRGRSSYDVKDILSIVTAIREGAVLSQIMRLENCELQEVVDDECHQAMLVLQTHGVLTTLKNYNEGTN